MDEPPSESNVQPQDPFGAFEVPSDSVSTEEPPPVVKEGELPQKGTDDAQEPEEKFTALRRKEPRAALDASDAVYSDPYAAAGAGDTDSLLPNDKLRLAESAKETRPDEEMLHDFPAEWERSWEAFDDAGIAFCQKPKGALVYGLMVGVTALTAIEVLPCTGPGSVLTQFLALLFGAL